MGTISPVIQRSNVALQRKDGSGEGFLLLRSWLCREHYLVSQSLVSHTSTVTESGEIIRCTVGVRFSDFPYVAQTPLS